MSGDAEETPSTLLQKAASGYRSTMATQVVRIACKLVSVVVMARLVAPAGYGDFAMAASVFWLIALLRDAGLGTAAIQAKSLTARQLNGLFWAHLGIGILLAGLTWISAPLAELWFKHETVSILLKTMSAAFLIMGAGGFMRAQLYREMRVPRANRLEAISAVVGTVAMVGAGYAGAGAYAFVVFLLVSELVATSLAWREVTWRPTAEWSGAELKPLWRVGRHVTLNHTLAFLATQLDAIVIGRWFGASAVGLYTRTGQLLTLPSLYVASPLNQVMLTTLSRLKNAAGTMDSHSWTAVTTVTHLALPFYVGCLVLPEPTVLLLLGDDWLAAAPLLQILAIGGAMTTITSMAQTMNIAMDRTDRLLGAALMGIVATVVALMIGGPFGLQGIAIAIATAQVLLVLPRLWWLLRDLPGSMRGYLAALSGPLMLAAGFAVGLAIGDHFATLFQMNLILRLALPLATSVPVLASIIFASEKIRNELVDTYHLISGRVRSSALDSP